MVKSPAIKYLTRITLSRVPNVQNGCKPYFIVNKVNGVDNQFKFDNLNEPEQVRFYKREEGGIDLEINTKIPICGSILIVFKHKGKMGESSMFRVSFHTAFIGYSNTLVCNRNQISPEDVQKDFKTFPASFEVKLEFEDFCKTKVPKDGG